MGAEIFCRCKKKKASENRFLLFYCKYIWCILCYLLVDCLSTCSSWASSSMCLALDFYQMNKKKQNIRKIRRTKWNGIILDFADGVRQPIPTFAPLLNRAHCTGKLYSAWTLYPGGTFIPGGTFAQGAFLLGDTIRQGTTFSPRGG